MRQYHVIKSEVPNTLLMFRLGDFYELFFDDAVRASDALDIALAQILKPDYIFRQGRLLKYCWPGEPPTHSWRALALRFRSPGGVSRLS